MDNEINKRKNFLSQWECNKKDLAYYIYSFVRDEDIVQEILQATVVTFYEKYDKKIDKNIFKYRAFRIAKNKLHEYTRQAVTHRIKEVSFEVVNESKFITPDEDFVEKLSKEDLKKRLQEIINELPEFDHELIDLRYFEQLPFKEIAMRLHKTEGTLRTYHFRLMHKIYKILTNKDNQK